MNNKIEDEVKKRMVAMVENPKFMKSVMDYAQPRLEEATEELGRRIARDVRADERARIKKEKTKKQSFSCPPDAPIYWIV